MFKAFPTAALTVEENNILMVLDGLLTTLENINLDEGWEAEHPHWRTLKKLVELQLEINSLREAYLLNLITTH